MIRLKHWDNDLLYAFIYLMWKGTNIGMKKKIAAVLAVITALMPCCALAEENVLSWDIKESTVINSVGKEMYGANYEWGSGVGSDSNVGYIWDMEGNPIDLNSAMQGYKLPFNRMAGGSANYFGWKNQISGSVDDKKYKHTIVQSTVDGAYSPRRYGEYMEFRGGIDTWVKTILNVDPEARFEYVVNFLWDDIENVADVVEYMTGDGSFNHNGGTNWAEVRKSNGLKDPIDVMCWELGNEVDLFGVDVDTYIKGCKKAIAAIRSVDPDAMIGAHIATSDTGAVGANWIRNVLKEIGNEIDIVFMHKYYGVKDVSRIAEPQISNVLKDLEQFGLADRIKIIYSEHATSPTSTNYTERSTAWPQTRSMGAVLNECDFFSRMWKYTNVIAANYHAFAGGPWSYLYYDVDGVLKTTAVCDVMDLYAKKGVGDVVENTLEGFALLSPADVTGNVIKTHESLNVFMANFKKEPATIDFNFENKYRIKKITRYSAEDKFSLNWYGQNDIEQVSEVCSDMSELDKYEIGGLSFVLLELEELK